MLAYIVNAAQVWADSLTPFETLMMLLNTWGAASITSALVFAGSGNSLFRQTIMYIFSVITVLMVGLIVFAGLSA